MKENTKETTLLKGEKFFITMIVALMVAMVLFLGITTTQDQNRMFEIADEMGIVKEEMSLINSHYAYMYDSQYARKQGYGDAHTDISYPLSTESEETIREIFNIHLENKKMYEFCLENTCTQENYLFEEDIEKFMDVLSKIRLYDALAELENQK
jgi:hypothetical protein